MKQILRVSIVFASVCLFSTALFGQNASFTGHVKDSTGAAVPKATVTVHDLQKGQDVATTTTTSSGDYTAPYLSPGSYTISVKAPGFRDEQRTDIPLQGSQVAVVDFTLQVGAVAQTVTVNGDEAMLDRGKADRGEVVEDARITELPLNGRNPVMLDRLNSSVIWDGNLIWMRPFDGQTYTNLHINGSDVGGGASYSTEIMLDGLSNQTPRPQNLGHTDVAYVAPDDAVQDFKIITNPYDAVYGRTRGGVIDMDLKTGTNKIHGDAYEYMRRTWLDANWWVNDALKELNPSKVASGIYNTPQHKLDQYGIELDGPLVIPHIYNGHDKTFFTAQVENWNENEPNTPSPIGVPLPQWSSGDFSGMTYGGKQVTIYNPYSTFVDSAGHVNRTPFPGNKIPAGMINPTAQKILSYYPAPNLPGDPVNWQQNFYNPTPTIDKYRNALIKLDHIFGPNDRFMIRYGYWERYEVDSGNQIPGIAGYGESPLGDRNHTFATEYTHTFSPNLIFDIRAMAAVKAEIAYTQFQGFDLSSLGWQASMTSQFGGFSGFPGVTLSGAPQGFAQVGAYGGANSTNANGLTTTDSLNLLPTVTWVTGKHTLHAGLDMRFYQYAVVQNPATHPAFSFDPQWTQNCWSCSAGSDYSGNDSNTEGNAVASMLLGLANPTTNDYIAPKAFYSAPYYAPFLQDDWKVTRNLTLNLGLRYDVQPYYRERHNRADYGFDTTDLNPEYAMLPTHTLANGQSFVDKGGVTFAGAGFNPRQIYATNRLDFGPRFGFAYAVKDKTVIRGGFGEVYQNSDAFPVQTGFSAQTSFNNSPDGGQTPVPGPLPGGFGGNLSNPFPTVSQPTGSSLGLQTSLGNNQSYVNPKFTIPNVWQFSFGFERQLTRNDTLEVSYVGNRAPNNEVSQNINPMSEAARAACNVQLGGNHHICDDTYGSGNTSSSNSAAIYGFVPNPYYQAPGFAGSALYSQKTRQALNWTAPLGGEFGSVTENQWNNGHSWYNSLQTTYQHRWSGGLTVHGTWTWSKLMEGGGWADNNYFIPLRKIDNSDRPHNITTSVVYDLPIGRGHRFFGTMNRIADAAVGGWEFAGMSIIQSGWPITVPSGWDYVGSAKIKPYWTPQHNLQLWAPCYWTTNGETGAISESQEAINFGCSKPDFIQIPSYGATPNNIYTGVREPWGIFEDSNLSKNFTIRENLKLQIRLETFNTFNHPLFQTGTYNGINQYAGQVGATTGGGQSNKPRYTQLAIKIKW